MRAAGPDAVRARRRRGEGRRPGHAAAAPADCLSLPHAAARVPHRAGARGGTGAGPLALAGGRRRRASGLLESLVGAAQHKDGGARRAGPLRGRAGHRPEGRGHGGLGRGAGRRRHRGRTRSRRADHRPRRRRRRCVPWPRGSRAGPAAGRTARRSARPSRPHRGRGPEPPAPPPPEPAQEFDPVAAQAAATPAAAPGPADAAFAPGGSAPSGSAGAESSRPRDGAGA